MAIEKMKHLRLVAVKSQREVLLRELMLLGCVEISEPETIAEDSELSGILSKESMGYFERRSDYDKLIWGISLLDKYAPQKTGFLSPKPEVSVSVILDDASLMQGLELAKRLDDADDHIRSIEAEESRIKGLLESLEPWRSMSVPFDMTETKTCNIIPGTVPAHVSKNELESELLAADCECAVYEISSDKDMHYLLVVLMKDKQAVAAEVFRKFGFSHVSLTELHGTAQENIKASKKRLEELEEKKKALTKEIISAAPSRDELKLCADRMLTKAGQAANGEKMLCTQSAITLEGWVPTRSLRKLEKVLTKLDCAWETSEPSADEYPDVPVKLRNNRLTRPLNMVTEMYSLPAYDGVDPNPLMAPFFILFYGIMMADMGYGLLMIIAAILVKSLKKPLGGMRNFCELLLLCGISTFVWGLMTGGFFGDAPYQVAKIVNPNTTWTGLPALFDPLSDTVMILLGSMALGFLHILTGMAVNFVEKLKRHEYLDAVFEELTWWIVFAGIACVALGVGPYVLYVGGALVVAGPLIMGKGFGKITGIFGSLYNHVTGFFGDILSYSRLMALMLAGSVIAQVFNIIGAIPGNLVVFIIISLVGNALNFALNLLGCYVHDLRLQCLEFFGKFYKDGGKPFRPLDVDTNYVNVVSK